VHILIVFASTEGHTRKLADFVASKLFAVGHQVVAHSAHDAPVQPDPAAFERVFLLGSLHYGRYQAPLVRYAHTHVASLNRAPSAFISVSLSAAGQEPADRKGLQGALDRFVEATGWTPRAVHHAAGAFAFSRYGWLKSLMMRWIARRRGLRLDPQQDYDLTDYERLASFAHNFATAGRAAA